MSSNSLRWWRNLSLPYGMARIYRYLPDIFGIGSRIISANVAAVRSLSTTSVDILVVFCAMERETNLSGEAALPFLPHFIRDLCGRVYSVGLTNCRTYTNGGLDMQPSLVVSIRLLKTFLFWYDLMWLSEWLQRGLSL